MEREINALSLKSFTPHGLGGGETPTLLECGRDVHAPYMC